VALPYDKSTSGERALGEINKTLQRFGCDKIGHMIDNGEGTALVQFEYRGRQVIVKASIKGYAAAWIKDNPLSSRSRTTPTEHQRKAMEVASVAVYSILRDWIKGQMTAIETGVISFEGAFLGNILLPSGKTVMQHAEESKLLKLAAK
jgi:hypothetical protein